LLLRSGAGGGGGSASIVEAEEELRLLLPCDKTHTRTHMKTEQTHLHSTDSRG
jgi:hypothetical protein